MKEKVNFFALKIFAFFLEMIWLLFPLLSCLYADPKTQGNCMSGKIYFNPSRIVSLENQSADEIDVNKYDLSIDYGFDHAHFDSKGAHLSVKRDWNGGQGSGTRLSTTRYIHYGKITARFRAIPVPGIISTFITMSDRKDEIDWEILGAHSTRAQTNVFYKGIEEFVIHNVEVSSPPIHQFIEYTIDWRSDSIVWSINGKVKRVLYKEQSLSRMIPPQERWFPSTPSKVQIAVWDGGDSPQSGVSKWAGGRVPWGSHSQFTAHYDYIDIQCYNDRNEIVPSWPPQPFINMSLPRQ